VKRELTQADREEVLRNVAPLLKAIYDSIAVLFQALNSWADQLLKDPGVQALLRQHPDFKNLGSD